MYHDCLGEQFDLSSQNDEFADEEDDDSSSVDNSEFITINVTNEAGEEKEIDHIKDTEHHSATSGGSSAAAATVGKGPNEQHSYYISPTATSTKLNQPSTSGQDNKYVDTIWMFNKLIGCF